MAHVCSIYTGGAKVKEGLWSSVIFSREIPIIPSWLDICGMRQSTHETGCVYLKDYVESWEMNRQCPLQAPTFTLPPCLHSRPCHWTPSWAASLCRDEVWDRLRLSSSESGLQPFPGVSFTLPKRFPFCEFFPLLPLHQTFSLEGMRLTFKYSWAK